MFCDFCSKAGREIVGETNVITGMNHFKKETVPKVKSIKKKKKKKKEAACDFFIMTINKAVLKISKMATFRTRVELQIIQILSIKQNIKNRDSAISQLDEDPSNSEIFFFFNPARMILIMALSSQL